MVLKKVLSLIKHPPYSTILVFSFSIFVLFYNLGGRYLGGWDEAYYVLMAQTAIQKGNYLILFEHADTIHWSKTPFPLYPMIAVFKVFGINEATARLSSAIFALGIFTLLFIIAKRYYGHWTAILSVLIITTTTQLIFDHGLKTGNIDSITLFFLIGSLSCWLLIKRVDYKIIFTMVSLGFTFLCKGPIIIIPLLVIASTLFISNPIMKIPLKPFLWGVVISGLIVLPWYFYAFTVYGNDFIQKHIVYNFIQRYIQGVEGHFGGNMFFLKVLLDPKNFIWFGTGIISFLYFIKKYFEGKKMIDFFVISWFIVSFLIINQSQTKLWWYIFPVYPAIIIMIARTIWDFVNDQNYLNRAAYYLGLIVMMTYFFNHKLFPDSSISNIVKTGMLTLVLYVTHIHVKRYFPKYHKGFNVLLVCIICAIPIYRTVDLTMYKNVNAPVYSIAKSLNSSGSVNTFGLMYSDPSALYYLKKKI